MHYIDYGLGVFQQSAFDVVPEGVPFDLAAVYQEMLRRKELAGFEVADRFYEIGSVEGLEETRKYLSGRGIQQAERSCHTQLSS
jgi:NDP-sugar pyrophosphorylase family protein